MCIVIYNWQKGLVLFMNHIIWMWTPSILSTNIFVQCFCGLQKQGANLMMNEHSCYNDASTSRYYTPAQRVKRGYTRIRLFVLPLVHRHNPVTALASGKLLASCSKLWQIRVHSWVTYLVIWALNEIINGCDFWHFLENTWGKWPDIWHGHVSWQPPEMIRFWLPFVD